MFIPEAVTNLASLVLKEKRRFKRSRRISIRLWRM